MQYINVKNIAETPLAGCLDIVEDLNNFELLRNNLADRIACYYNLSKAHALKDAIMIEGREIKQVPLWEYVINELQYEFRVAAVWGELDKLNHEYESQLLNQWVRHIIHRKDVDTSLEFITVLKANRLKRVR